MRPEPKANVSILKFISLARYPNSRHIPGGKQSQNLASPVAGDLAVLTGESRFPLQESVGRPGRAMPFKVGPVSYLTRYVNYPQIQMTTLRIYIQALVIGCFVLFSTFWCLDECPPVKYVR